MSRARELASLASPGTFTIDAANSRVGVASTTPESTMDCGGTLTADTINVDNFTSTNLSVPGTFTVGAVNASGTFTVGTVNASGTVTANQFSGGGASITGISTNNIVDYGVGLGGGGGADGLWGEDSVGIHTHDKVGIGSEAVDGYSLFVLGDTRIVGILTVGESSITLNPNDNQITGVSTMIVSEVKVVSGGHTSFIKATESGIQFEDSDGESIGVGHTFITISSGVVTTTKINQNYLIDTSTGVSTAYLPHPVTPGDYITISDSAGSFNTNSFFIVPNESATGPATYIHGALTSLEADVQYATATLTYTGFSTTGWTVK